MSETTDQPVVKPYSAEGSKKEQVAEMFDNIAPKYDFLNRSLSMGIDVLWRRKAIRMLQHINPQTVLDVATGTGDVALEIHRQLKPTRIVGLDLSPGMLEVGKRKIANKGLTDSIEMVVGDSENLPFEDNTFDAITVAFGVRNFENLNAGLMEMNRVLKPGGKLIVLEFSHPRSFPFKQIYWTYFNHILPFFGKMVSKDSSAYTYLPESVKQFPDGDAFIKRLNETSYQNPTQRALTFGIASIYTADKN